MGNKYLGDFIAIGKNIHIDIKKRNIKYSKQNLKIATTEIINMIKEYIDEVYTEMVKVNKYKGVHEYPYIFAPFFSSKTFDKMKDLLFSNDMSFVEAFNKSISWFMKDEKLNIFAYLAKENNKESMIRETIKIKERTIKYINRHFIQKLANQTDEDVIISINKFEKEYFYEIPINIKGFVCRSVENEMLIKDMVYAYEIPIVITTKNVYDSKLIIIDNKNKKLFINPNDLNLDKSYELLNKTIVFDQDEPKYDSNVINYYASLVDLRYLDIVKANGWYKGGVFFRTEYIFLSKGFFPRHDELVGIFTNLMNAFQDREIQIQLPEFNHYKQLDYEIDDEIYTEVEQVSIYHRIFFRTANAVYEASNITHKKVTLVIPTLRVGTEVYHWKDKIDCFLGIDRSIETGPKFGITMETESAIEYFEDYREVNSIVFGMDNYIEEALEMSRYDEIDKEYFMRAAWPDMHLAHQFYRKNGIRMLQIMYGFILREPFFLKKFINKGFKHFIIPLSTLKMAEEVLFTHESTRGKYIGVHAKRKSAKLIK